MSLPTVEQRVGRRRVGGVVIAAACLLAFLAGPTQASAAKSPSALLLLAFSATGPSTGVGGVVASPNRKCLAGRKVELTVIFPTKEKVVDVAKTGKNGGWFARGATGTFDDSEGIRVRLAAKKIGKGDGAVKCGRDTLESV